MAPTNPLVSFAGQPTTAQQIQDLMDEVNRQSDQLDSFNNKLSIAAADQFQFAIDGTVTSYGGTFTHSLNYSPAYIAYYNLSTEPGVWRLCNDERINSSGVVTQAILVNTDAQVIRYTYTIYSTVTACTVTVKWMMFKEPAQQTQ